MKIFVTGASGFIGSRVATYFSRRKHKVICNYYNRSIKIKNVKKIKIDISKKFFIKDEIDTIIHCASKTPVNCKSDKQIYTQNVKMMKSLILLSKKKKIKNFIFLSSVSAYGNIRKKLLYENLKPIQPNSYGRSKIYCEKLLTIFSKKNNIKYLNVRLPGVIGYGSHGNFLSYVLKNIISNKVIKASNKSSFFNNVIFVDELSKFLEIFIKKGSYKFNHINIASKNRLKIKTVINLIYRFLEKPKKIIWVDSKKKPFCIDFKRALKCGYKPESVKNSLKKIVLDYRNNL